MTKPSTFATLIELRQRELDALRQRLGEFEAQQRQFEFLLRERIENLRQESEAAQNSVEMGAFFASYAKRNRDQQKQFRQAITRLQGQIDELREMIRGAFSELKKLELARDLQLEREKKELARKDGQFMDELGIRAFLRREE